MGGHGRGPDLDATMRTGNSVLACCRRETCHHVRTKARNPPAMATASATAAARKGVTAARNSRPESRNASMGSP